MNANEGRERGMKLAELGIKRAACRNELPIRRDTLLFLDALLSSPTGCATLDDATDDPKQKYADGGRWRGSIPLRLKSAGLIAFERVVKSARRSQHGGYLTEWRLVDPHGATAMRATLAAELQQGEAKSPQSTSIQEEKHERTH